MLWAESLGKRTLHQQLVVGRAHVSSSGGVRVREKNLKNFLQLFHGACSAQKHFRFSRRVAAFPHGFPFTRRVQRYGRIVSCPRAPPLVSRSFRPRLQHPEHLYLALHPGQGSQVPPQPSCRRGSVTRVPPHSGFRSHRRGSPDRHPQGRGPALWSMPPGRSGPRRRTARGSLSNCTR